MPKQLERTNTEQKVTQYGGFFFQTQSSIPLGPKNTSNLKLTKKQMKTLEKGRKMANDLVKENKKCQVELLKGISYEFNAPNFGQKSITLQNAIFGDF